MNEALISRALDASVRAAFSEMLSGVPFAAQGCPQTFNAIGDATIVSMSGQLCGSLITLTPRDSTLLLARRIAGSLLDDDDGQMSENGFLTVLEQDSIRELSNRIGCIFAGALTDAGSFMAPTVPLFVCGQEIQVAAESDYNASISFVVDGSLQLDAYVFLSVPKPEASRSERIRELEQIRAQLLADEHD